MARKSVLVAGASGLVGYAAMQHFGGDRDCDVVVLSRRRPDEVFGAHHLSVDLTDQDATAAAVATLGHVTHVIYAALYERPGLIEGWRDTEQIAINDRMLRNLMEPLRRASPGLRHVSLLQGTKAYGVHARPMAYPAREGRSDARDVPNFYWQQESYLREIQRGADWTFTIFRPVLIVGYSQGSAMNLIPAIGVYAAMLKDADEPLHYPGGPGRVSQAIDASLLARVMAWAGEAEAARGETFNVANGDVFSWPNVWPAIADAFGMQPGQSRPCFMEREIRPRAADWARIRLERKLVSPDLDAFVGLSFQYADYQMGTGRTEPAPTAFSSTIKLLQAGFHEVMDTEVMVVDAIREFQRRRLF